MFFENLKENYDRLSISEQQAIDYLMKQDNIEHTTLKEIKQETQSLLTALSESLKSQQWTKASQQCDKLRFTRKLSEEIERVEEHLFEL